MPDRDPIEEQLESRPDQNQDLIPQVEIPTIDSPDAELDDADLNTEAVALFWKLVLVFNVALFGVTVGPMVLYFRGDLAIGGGLLIGGLIAGGYGMVRYWLFKRGRQETSTG